MKLGLLILSFQILLSCNNNISKETENQNSQDTTGYIHDLENKKFTVLPDIILKDYITWYNYTYDNVQLSQDFIALDTDSEKIDKTAFLNKLMTGNVVAFKTMLIQGEPVYKLFPLKSNNKNIKSTIIQLASIEMKNFKMEGNQLPKFDFIDLNGNNYNPDSTKGKILVLKCWFIHCAACVREFPETNELVDEYKDRKDILFISLASDPKKNLTEFLQTNKLNYVVIPNMDNYMTDKLNINEYPTHLLIDKTGKIVKVVNSIEELKPFLKKEAAKNKSKDFIIKTIFPNSSQQ